MTSRLHPNHDRPVDPKLAELLEKAKNHVMTKEEFQAQRRSWVIGNLALDKPDTPIEEIAASVDKALERGF